MLAVDALAGRRTLRDLGQSAAWLAIVTAAGLAERDPKPEVAARDDDAARQRNVRVDEVPHRAPGGAAAMGVHVPNITEMSEDARRVRTSHGELSLEEIGELLPGTGEIMQSVGNCWWKCAHAARGGNFALAGYFARRVRGLQSKLAIVRPKYEPDLAAFDIEYIAPVLAACDGADRAVFDRAYDAAVDKANELHSKWGKPYIRWTLPPDPPTDLELTRD